MTKAVPCVKLHGTAFASLGNISEASVVLLTVLILLVLSVLILLILVLILTVLLILVLVLLILSVLVLLILIVIIEHGVYFLFKNISENSCTESLSFRRRRFPRFIVRMISRNIHIGNKF